MKFPVFRKDLEVTAINSGGDNNYLVRDPMTGDVYSFGEEELFLCRHLDGRMSPYDLHSLVEKRFDVNMDRDQMSSFIHYLGENNLLAGSSPVQESVLRYFQFLPPEAWKRWKLFNPEGILNHLNRIFSWCYTIPFVLAGCIIFLLAIGVVFFNFTAILTDIKLLIAPLTIFQVFAAMYIFINFPQELVRGAVSSRFGGHSSEYGIWLAYNVFPRFYCLGNISDITEKSKRSWAFFSPSAYAIFIGSVGILMWKMTSSHVFLHKFGLVLGLLSTVDSMIRLNFLWPVEGHYLVSNWLNVPNFRKRTIDTVKSWIFHRPMPEPLRAGEKRMFMAYGVLTLLVTFPSLAVLLYFLGKMLIDSYTGFGGIIILGIISVKYRKGFLSIFKENKMLNMESPVTKTTKGWRKTKYFLLSLTALAIMLIPYPYEPGGPFILKPFERMELHTQVSGEIKQVMVKENDAVTKGAVQVLIDTREHQKNLDVTGNQLEKARADLKLLEKGPKPEEVEKAKQQVETAKTQLDYSTKEKNRLEGLFKEGVIPEEEYLDAARRADVDQKNLEVARANLELVRSGARDEEIEAQRAVIRDLEAKVKFYNENLELTKLLAPISGRVVTPYMETKVGHVLKEGDLVAEYESTETIQAELQIPEADIGEVKPDARVKLRLEAYPTKLFYGTVVMIAPKAEETSNGKIVRVMTNIPNAGHELKPEMTGEAKIKGSWKPLIIAFSRAIVRFFMVEVWSWFP